MWSAIRPEASRQTPSPGMALCDDPNEGCDGSLRRRLECGILYRVETNRKHSYGFVQGYRPSWDMIDKR